MRSLGRVWATGIVAAAILGLSAGSAQAWHHEGHHLIAMKAVGALPESVPAFFREGAASVAHFSIDPDLVRNPMTPMVNDGIGPEHFLDVELLQGRKPPRVRSQYLIMLNELKVGSKQAGFLPYSVSEWTESLMVAFAEHRKWPDNPHIRMKCLVYAGFIAHYGADLHQPLHTTIHFDGRVGADGKSPRSGIHAKVDDLLFRYKLEDVKTTSANIKAFSKLLPGVMEHIERSHALVDKVYEFEPLLPEVPKDPKDKKPVGPGKLDAKLEAFALDRAAAAVELTASLLLTAWEHSAKISLPEFMDRAAQDAEQGRASHK